MSPLIVFCLGLDCIYMFLVPILFSPIMDLPRCHIGRLQPDDQFRVFLSSTLTLPADS